MAKRGMWGGGDPEERGWREEVELRGRERKEGSGEERGKKGKGGGAGGERKERGGRVN